MIHPEIAHILLPAIVSLSILLMLIRPRGVPEVYWISGGALLLVVLRLIPLNLAGTAVAKGSDVYLFLIGMMLLSELASANGVFDWISSVAVRSANGSSIRLFTLVYGIGTLTTIFMSNDATAVVLTPAILTAVRRAKVEPLPHLFACALIANAASFVLPISNPANLVVFHQGMPPLGHWLLSFLVPSILSIAITYVVMRILFKSDLQGKIEEEVNPESLTMNGKLVLVAGLFVMVDAVESMGALKVTAAALHWAQHLVPAAGALAVSFVVGVANNVVNNLPLGLIAGGTLQAAHASGLIANAVLIGVDLGPNLSVTGSLATILWLLALRKEKIEVSFWRFLKVGAVAMPAALLLAIGGAILMQTLFKMN